VTKLPDRLWKLPRREDDEAADDEGMGRILALSDGVFAIAITLLILEIAVPATTSGAGLTKALLGLWPRYLAVPGVRRGSSPRHRRPGPSAVTCRLSASVFHITSASLTAASAAKNTACSNVCAMDDAAASDSRVLPTPPVLVSVTRCVCDPSTIARSRSRSSSRPISGVGGTGRLVGAPRLFSGGKSDRRPGPVS
jgi:transmembrane protein TMEM174 (potassium channel)